VGLGSEILFLGGLAALVLGPRQLHSLLRHLARAKAQFEEASRAFKSRLDSEFEAAQRESKARTQSTRD
jgi:Sec-independent protein translocase protein TatA